MEKNALGGQITDISYAITKEKKLNHNKSVVTPATLNTQSKRFPKPNSKKYSGNRAERNHYLCKDDQFNVLSWDSQIQKASNLSCSNERDFVTATCKILMYPGSNIITPLKNPDVSINWNNVFMLHCNITEPTYCPICLYPPKLPRMGPCGHIYCWYCVKQFITFENELLSKRCAVCNVFLRESELKRVRICSINLPCVGNLFELTLVKRHKEGLHPLSQMENHQLKDYFDVNPQNLISVPFSRVVISSSADIKQILVEETELVKEYQTECLSDSDSSSIVPFLDEISFILSSELSGIDVYPESTHNTSELLKPDFDTPDRYYTYYQDVNGYDIFLHGVNWRCLLLEYEEKEMPNFISGRVVEVDCYSMTYDLRKRYRFLSHLPIGRLFYFVELNLQPPLVSVDSLEKMSEFMSFRVLKREQKKRIDQKLTKAKEDSENRLEALAIAYRSSNHTILKKEVVPTEADFFPLSSSSTIYPATTKFNRSFASVSNAGANQIVDDNQVANFPKRPSGDAPHTFHTFSENWPSLLQSSKITPTICNSQNTEIGSVILETNSTSESFPNLNLSTEKKEKSRKNKHRKPTYDMETVSKNLSFLSIQKK